MRRDSESMMFAKSDSEDSAMSKISFVLYVPSCQWVSGLLIDVATHKFPSAYAIPN
jgi:hypothetical protein